MWVRAALLFSALAGWFLPSPAAHAASWLGTIGDSLSEPYTEVDPFFFDGFLRPAGVGWPFLGTPVPANPTPVNWTDQLQTHRAGQLTVENYALGGADTATLLDQNQDGLAAAEATSQLAAGIPAFVSVGIGTNNFQPFGFPGLINTYRGIDNGCLSLTSCPTPFQGSNGLFYSAVDTYVGDVLAEFATALSVVVGSGADVVVLGPASWSGFPGTTPSTGLLPNAIVDAAVDLVIAGQRDQALAQGLAFVELQALLDNFPGLTVGGLAMLPGHPTPGTRDPRHWFLPDGIHPDTIASGLIANAMMTALNHSGAGLTLFTDAEILAFAGLTPDSGWNGVSLDVSGYVSVPEANTALLGLAASLALAQRRRRGRRPARAGDVADES